jgi:glycosyltransferase involved in cell wall biosynthesis
MMIGPYPTIPDRIDGGVAAATTYLSEALIKGGGIELIGVRICGQSDASHGNSFGWPIEDLPLGRLSLATIYARQRKRLLTLIRQYRPDVIHAQGADLAGMLAIGSGLPAVVTVHGLLAECARFQTNRLNRLRALLAATVTEQRTVQRATHLIAISPYVTQYYQDHISGRVYDIPNAIAPGFFRVNRAPESGRILFAGRIANGKGLMELLHAASSNRGVLTRVILAGATPDPDYEMRLRTQIARLGLSDHVEFAGLLDEDSLIREFERAEALVLPSFQETAPMVVQQAMAAGLPVVATRVGGIPYQIEHRVTGLLVAVGDVAGLATAIRSLVKDAGLAERLSATSKSEALKHYSADKIAAATSAVYHAAISAASQNQVRKVFR